MLCFKMYPAVTFTIDLRGVAIRNGTMNVCHFIEYPKAAVWLVMVNDHSPEDAVKILSAILDTGIAETEEFIKECLMNWKELSLIEDYGKPIDNQCLQ